MRVMPRDATRLTAAALLAAGLLAAAVWTAWPGRAQLPRPPARFPSGIYYIRPHAVRPGGVLTRLGGDLGFTLNLPPNGFDLRPNKLVYTLDSAIHLVDPSGEDFVMVIPSLSHMAFPSFSPDGRKLTVQAIDDQNPGNLNIYVIDLDTGHITQVSRLPGSELRPEWSPTDQRLAYTSVDPQEVDLHIYDLTNHHDSPVVRFAMTNHLTFMPEGREVLDPRSLRRFDVRTGRTTRALGEAVRLALLGQGFMIDGREPGRLSGGACPIDGDVSPDGRHVVVDCAVQRDGRSGVILVEVSEDAALVDVLTDILPINPAYSDHHSFSQTNPAWL